ncbi:MAG: hypothetical protein ACI4HO_11320 [Ruminococcus sp.]
MKNQARHIKPDYKFRKALNNEEWGSFYASVIESNQRDSFLIGDNGVLIPNENYHKNYILVCYEGDSNNPCVTAVYKLLNYDYTIHDKKADVTKIIIRLEEEGYNDKHIRAILQNYTSLYGPLFEKYNRKSGKYIKLTRESVPNRGNVEVESDRTGISKNAEQGISDNEVADNIKYQSRTSDLDNKYLNAVNSGDIETAQKLVDEKSDIRYQARDFSYENIDLSTLDDNELKVYNRRGWANELFTKEDRVLLNEKFNELNSKSSQRTDNVLGDGSRVVEINNKIVLIGGTFEEPIIHGVFVINTDNETEANIYKEIILNEYDEYKQGKHQFASICELFESVLGNKNVRNYESTDFRYYKGRKDSGERAILPHSFKSYGYTKQFQDGTGVNTETERSISDEINSEKYQERYDPISNRELLANALETTAKTSREKSNLRAYKEGVESLNKDSERLAEIRKRAHQMRALSLAIACGHARRN